MALSYTQWMGDGSTQTFAISFPYLDKAHVEARVALELVSFTWDDDATIRISPAPAPGAVVEARRVTPRDTRLVDFSDGSTLTETDLDLSATQTFYIVQEAIDIAGGTLELLADGSYGAGGRRIKNLGAAEEPRDAVTKEYHDGVFIPQMTALLNQTVAARGESVSANEAAQTARGAAVAARDLALQYRDAAGLYRNEARAAATAAAQAEENTQGHRQAAETAKEGTAADRAQTALDRTATGQDRQATAGDRTATAGFRDEARQAAANAATFDPGAFYTRGQVDGILEGYAPWAHGHTIGAIQNLQTTLDGKAPMAHNHNGSYIRYDAFQSMTSSQQATARNNINALGVSGFPNQVQLNWTQGAGMGRLVLKQNTDGGFANEGLAILTAAANEIWGMAVSGSGHLMIGYNGTIRGYWDKSNGAFTAGSDRDIKNDIVTMEDQWAAVRSLRPVRFTLKSDPSAQPRVGFIAQEVMETIPEAVNPPQDEMINMYTLDTMAMVPVLAKALQEAMARIEALEARE